MIGQKLLQTNCQHGRLDKMRIWEVAYYNGRCSIVFAHTRLEIWNKYPGIYKITEVVIH
jgi:hypothetical protein